MSSPHPLPEVSIVIPVFNKWELTAACLRSLREANRLPGVEVIVVDNGSTDETALRCAELGASLFQQGFHYLRNEENQDFARACNRGAQAARSGAVFFLNNDTLWCADILPLLLRELDRPNVGGCGPLLLYPGSETVQHLGIAFLHSSKVAHAFHHYPRGHRVARTRIPLQAITAAALLMRRELFLELGGFYAEYRNGYEDLDLCHRVNQRGLRLTVALDAPLYHLEGQSQGRMDREAHNYSIYQQRVGKAFDTDVDVFAQGNAMELRLNDWFEPYYVPDQDLHLEYMARVERKGLTEAMDILEEEPGWEQGYLLLVDRLVKGGMKSEALVLAQDLFSYCPGMRALDLVCQLSKAVGQTDVLASHLELRHRVQTITQGAAHTAKALEMLRMAREQGRELLATALKQWMVNHATG